MSNNKHGEHARPTILIVDDDPSNLAALGGLLLSDYEVLAASSGERALLIAASKPKPDLILLDVLMPGMNGLTVLTRLHDDTNTCDIPVIFVSGLDSVEDEGRGLELGAVDYITKPYRTPIILARVRTQLELKRARNWLRDQNIWLEAELAKRVNETQQAQIQLLQSEKLAAIGLLAAGMAHEINNPVGYVRSNLGSLDAYLRDLFELLDAYKVLEARCPSTESALLRVQKIAKDKDVDFLREDIGQLLSESRQGLERVSKIVSNLKDFSRAESNDWQWANLVDGLESTLNIVWNEIKYHCTLHKNYDDIPHVYCIPSQINQVLLNLLVNAAQAIPDKGAITICTKLDGGDVCISVADTGTGIPEENLPRLFEPFFTTKPAGKGSGLGLSISYGIVRDHGGRIEVKSMVGHGTTFTVRLPVIPQAKIAAQCVGQAPE